MAGFELELIAAGRRFTDGKYEANALNHSTATNTAMALVHPLQQKLLCTVALTDPLCPPSSVHSVTTRGFLEDLPPRSGSRPVVEGIYNHRQLNQLAPNKAAVTTELCNMIGNLNHRFPSQTYLGRSTFEGGNISLYFKHRVYNQTQYHGQVINVDVSAGFVHLALHPADVKVVLAKQWGQRHPLASRRGAWLLGQENCSATNGCYVMVYAPRNAEELGVVEEIMNAAIWWAGGIESPITDDGCDEWSDVGF